MKKYVSIILSAIVFLSLQETKNINANSAETEKQLGKLYYKCLVNDIKNGIDIPEEPSINFIQGILDQHAETHKNACIQKHGPQLWETLSDKTSMDTLKEQVSTKKIFQKDRKINTILTNLIETWDYFYCPTINGSKYRPADLVSKLSLDGAIILNLRLPPNTTLLQVAISTGDENLVPILIKYGADQSQIFDHGNTIYHLVAARYPEYYNDFVETLNRETLVNGTDRLYNPAIASLKNNQQETAKEIAQKGISKNNKTSSDSKYISFNTRRIIRDFTGLGLTAAALYYAYCWWTNR